MMVKKNVVTMEVHHRLRKVPRKENAQSMLIKEESRKSLRSWGQGADASNIKSKECPTFYPENWDNVNS
jgi:hypothetical protein